jgi:hypothetical protein
MVAFECVCVPWHVLFCVIHSTRKTADILFDIGLYTMNTITIFLMTDFSYFFKAVGTAYHCILPERSNV